MLLLDTNILIDYTRRKPEASIFLENLAERPLISSMTVAELYAGVREGKEREVLREVILLCEVIPVSQEIAEKGGLYRRNYGQSHGTDLIDGLIAATVEIKDATLVTLNRKHFPMLKEILTPY